MSTQPTPEPIPVAARPFDPAHARRMPSRRPHCRALTVHGRRCKNFVLGGLHLCFNHYRNRRPALPEPTQVSVPLLENHAAIQLMTTQVLQGLLSLRLDPLRARVSLAALRIAALTLPRPAKLAEPDLPEDSVCYIARDHEDFISADPDLDEPPLNPACSVPESVDAARELLDTFDPASHCHSEVAPPDLPPVDPTHDRENCPCFTCADARADRAQWLQNARLRESAREG